MTRGLDLPSPKLDPEYHQSSTETLSTITQKPRFTTRLRSTNPAAFLMRNTHVTQQRATLDSRPALCEILVSSTRTMRDCKNVSPMFCEVPRKTQKQSSFARHFRVPKVWGGFGSRGCPSHPSIRRLISRPDPESKVSVAPVPFEQPPSRTCLTQNRITSWFCPACAPCILLGLTEKLQMQRSSTYLNTKPPKVCRILAF